MDKMFITDAKWLEKAQTKYRAWQGIPSIARTKGGKLFVSFFTGGTSEELGNFGLVIKSDNNGETWTEPIAAMYNGNLHRCIDPCLWIDPLGRLWVFWAVLPEPKTYAVICENPDADELIWSDEFYVGDGVMINKPIVLSNGKWLFPIALWHKHLLYASQNSGKPGAYVYTSDDNGKTFNKLGAPLVRFPGYDESMVIERTDGSLMMMIRTTTGTNVAYSYDYGKTWTDSSPSNIENPVTRFHLKKLKSGRLLLINNFSTASRTNLTACLSEDDGRTWKYKLLIDTRDYVCYPDADCDENGNIYIVYEHGRGVFKRSLEEIENIKRQLLMCVITEEDIINGKPLDEEGKLGKVISELGRYEGNREELYKIPFYNIDALKEYILADDDEEKAFEDFIHPICLFYDASKVDYELLKTQFLQYRKTKEEKILNEIIITLNPVKTKGTYVIVNENGSACGIDEWIFNSTVDMIIKNGFECTSAEIGKKLDISPYYIERIFRIMTKISIEEYKNTHIKN